MVILENCSTDPKKKKVKFRVNIDPEILLLGIYLTEVKTYFLQKPHCEYKPQHCSLEWNDRNNPKAHQPMNG